jgi:hypothetical protein
MAAAVKLLLARQQASHVETAALHGGPSAAGSSLDAERRVRANENDINGSRSA